MLRQLTFAAALITVAGATQVLAAPATVIVRETVYVGDLDPSTADGARAVESRVARAAARLCYQTPSPALRGLANEVRRCRNATLSAAMADYRNQQSQLAQSGAGAEKVATIALSRP